MRRNSVRVVRVIFYPRIDVHPVHFPSLSSILRERLFKMAFIWGDERLDPAHKDCSAVQRFLVVELSLAIVEVPDHRLAQSAVVARGPYLVPLASLRIIQTQGQTLDVTGRSVSFKFLEVRAAIPDLPDDRGTVVSDPRSRSGQGMN